jgi:hypothetical protein
VLVLFEAEQRSYNGRTSTVKLVAMINVYGGLGKDWGEKRRSLFNDNVPNGQVVE